MKLVKVRLDKKITRAPGVESFRFIPAEKVEFIAGQFLQVIFDETSKENKELNKYLSFSSSPLDEYIEVTKRLSGSPFSQKLKGLKAGDEILLRAPFGSCVFDEHCRKIAFLIGGIGITPVISILEYIVGRKLNTDVVLLYSNRNDEEISFRKELDYWQSINDKLRIVYTVTDCRPKDNKCIYGYINNVLLLDAVPDISERVFFIFGPPRMVEAMTALCLDAGINKENIRTESFIGY
jgi:glycine betaine catabolism B